MDISCLEKMFCIRVDCWLELAIFSCAKILLPMIDLLLKESLRRNPLLFE